MDPETFETVKLVAQGFVAVVVSDLIGNTIAFKNRIVNALVTGIVFALIFYGLLLARLV